MKRQLSVFLLLVCASQLPTTARAQSAGTDPEQQAVEGLEAFDSGRFVDAEQKLGQASEQLHLPTITSYWARSLLQIGKMVKASEAFLLTTQMSPLPGQVWKQVQYDAQREAARSFAELGAKIPRLVVRVAGVEPAEVAVSIDGVDIPDAQLGAEQKLDPGDHVVVGRSGQQQVAVAVSLKQGERIEARLDFSIPTAQAPLAPIPSTRPSPEQQTASREGTARPSLREWVGWGTVGLGGVGILVGSIEGLVARSKRSSLQGSADCSGDPLYCARGRAGDVDSYMQARTVSSIGFIAGGVLVTAGLASLVLWKSDDENRRSLALDLAPNYVGVRGNLR